MTTTKFEEIIGNPRIFNIILDEFFHDWPGSYDIMPVENPEDRKFKDYDGFAKFCQKVRSNEEGLRRCMDCDLEFAEKARISGKPLYYACHAGLMDIAVPIIVGNELVATIFCGQHRSQDEEAEKKATQKTLSTEVDLGFEHRELLKLRDETPVVSFEKIEEVKEKLWEVATYVSNLGSSKLEAEKAKKELATRLRETDAIQKILFELSEIIDDVNIFWERFEVVLEKICGIIGAEFGLFITCETKIPTNEPKGLVRSVANLPSNIQGRYLFCNSIIAKVLDDMQPAVAEFSPNRFSGDLVREISTHLQYQDNSKMAIVPIKLEPEHKGVMLFFMSNSKDADQGLKIEDELALLAQAGSHIATAYGNCLLYQEQKKLAEIKSDWLENVSHQILAPINGILGQTENLSKYFRVWQKTNPHRIDNALVTLTELAEWTNRMAKNFAWVANDRNHPRELHMRLEDDVPGKLIGYARDVQGFAKTRGITRVHVDSESVNQLNNRIVIDNKLFKQAITNLLDNAVKYANSKTEIMLNARLTLERGHIDITSYGIPLLEADVENIFERYYRTEAAKKRYVIGSGIGLEIAREIMRFHGGDLVAIPSIQTVMGWKTTFVISLPLK